jgi:hypothetical protein
MRLRTTAVRALCALAAATSFLALPATAPAATGTYTIGNTGWTQQGIYNVRFWLNGTTITPPAGVPANATIYRTWAWLQWESNAPSGSVYRGTLCNRATMVCGTIPLNGGQGVSGEVTALNGLSAATTTFVTTAEIDDFSSSSIHAAVSPPRFTNSKGLIVYYTY